MAYPNKKKKKKEQPPEELEDASGRVRFKLPNEKYGELFAVSEQELGGSRMRVICGDSVSRMGRIPGKFKKRMWIKTKDILIVKPWDFQDSKCDIIHRYTPAQASYLKRKKIIPEILRDERDSSDGK